MFHVFQSSVIASVFMLQVSSVLSGCCICFHTYVASLYYRYFICFRCMLHAFWSGCCICFHTYVAIVCSKMFPRFQSSVAVSVFMLQVSSVLSGCCICFHTYVVSVYYKCFICFRRMLHSSILYCTCCLLFREPGAAREWGAAIQWPAEVACGVLGAVGWGRDGAVSGYNPGGVLRH
jgi:hypothetical protein